MGLNDLRGISPAIYKKLKAKGIDTEEELLKAGNTAKARQELASSSGVDGKALLELLNRADLARVKGIGEVYSNLLEEVGVDTVKELATRVPANLCAKIVEVNTKKKLTERPPTEGMVADWVAQAKALPKILEY